MASNLLQNLYDCLKTNGIFRNQQGFWGFIYWEKGDQAFGDTFIADMDRLLATKSKKSYNSTETLPQEVSEHYEELPDKGDSSRYIRGEKEFPKHFKKYLIENNQGEQRYRYIYPLAWLLQYYAVENIPQKLNISEESVRSVASKFAMHNADYFYNEYFSLSDDSLRSLNDSIIDKFEIYSEITTFLDLATFIARVLYEHIFALEGLSPWEFQEILNEAEVLRKNQLNDPDDINALKKYVAEKAFYEDTICIYDVQSIDRFFRVKEHCRTNSYCALEMGDTLYNGRTFFVSPGVYYQVDKDIRGSIECYAYAKTAVDNMPCAYWNLALLARKYVKYDSNLERHKEISKLYKKAGDYAPAIASYGALFHETGNNYLKAKEHDKAIECYIEFLRLNFQALESGWIFAANAIAVFLRQRLQNEQKELLDALFCVEYFQLFEIDIEKTTKILSDPIEKTDTHAILRRIVTLFRQGHDYEGMIRELFHYTALFQNPWSMTEYSIKLMNDKPEVADIYLKNAGGLRYWKAYEWLAELHKNEPAAKLYKQMAANLRYPSVKSK